VSASLFLSALRITVAQGKHRSKPKTERPTPGTKRNTSEHRTSKSTQMLTVDTHSNLQH
jgi:hypothetical protein